MNTELERKLDQIIERLDMVIQVLTIAHADEIEDFEDATDMELGEPDFTEFTLTEEDFEGLDETTDQGSPE